MDDGTAACQATVADCMNHAHTEEAPPVGALRMHAGGISDGELMFPSPPPSLPRRPENYLKNVRAGDVDVRRVESGCALAGLWL